MNEACIRRHHIELFEVFHERVLRITTDPIQIVVLGLRWAHGICEYRDIGSVEFVCTRESNSGG